MNFTPLSQLSEEQFESFLALKRRQLTRGRVKSERTCNRLNRRRWSKRVLRAYRLHWRKIHRLEAEAVQD